MNKYRRYIFALTALLLLITIANIYRPQTALAHPLGNFTINRYSRIEPYADRVYLRYVLDMAEIPTFQEMAKIDLNNDGEISDAERDGYLTDKAGELQKNIRLEIDDSFVNVRLLESDIAFPPGQGDLFTLRLTLLLDGQYKQSSKTGKSQLYYRDNNYAQRLGWREIIVRPGAGVSLLESSVPEDDRSNELRNYPQNLLQNPPSLQEARLIFAADESAASVRESQSASVTEPSNAKSGDFLTSLITVEQLSLPIIVLSLVVSLGLGAVHAISPGHGKTIMAAYLVGTRGTARHAVFLGLTVTVSHTLGVLGLGLVILFASNIISPERLYPWLGLISGFVVMVIGIWLLVARLLGNRAGQHHHHEDSHAHHHGPLNHESSSGPARIFQRLTDLGAKVFHGHSHHDEHSHSHDDQRQHSHTSDNRISITWKSLTALGIVGGLVPSVSALVILLAAISLHRIGFGIMLILSFSAGMALVLAGIGLLLVYAGKVVERFRGNRRHTRLFAQALPLVTAFIVLVSGAVVAARAVFEMGIL